MRRHNLKEFELSQAYLFFWDKLEKANYFLEQVLDTTEEELESRLVQTLLSSPVGDGGQWDMVANLVEKYGLVRLLLGRPVIERSRIDCHLHRCHMLFTLIPITP